jgi:hypothetical protein
MRWFEVDRAGEIEGRGYFTRTFRQKTYVLVWMTPERSLDHRDGQKPWALTNAERDQGSAGAPVAAFTLDSQGAWDFGNLTKNNLYLPLGVFLGGKLINAAVIRSMITDHGLIDGGRKGFSKSDLDYLVNTLRAGSLPAELSSDPVVEEMVHVDLESPWRRRLVIGGIVLAVGDLLLAYFLLFRRPPRRATPPPLPAILGM